MDAWNEMSGDQIYQLEMKKLDLQQLELSEKNEMTRADKVDIARRKATEVGKGIKSALITIAVFIGIAILGCGITFVIMQENKELKEQRIAADVRKHEADRVKETEMAKLRATKPVRDTLYDTITVIRTKDIIGSIQLKERN